MIYLPLWPLVIGWILASPFASAQTSSQSDAVEYYATQSASPSSGPPFSIAKRRQIKNCNEQWMKDTEAQGTLPHSLADDFIPKI